MPKEAKKAAASYFVDLEDMFVTATKKDGAKVRAAYDKSVVDMGAYRALVNY